LDIPSLGLGFSFLRLGFSFLRLGFSFLRLGFSFPRVWKIFPADVAALSEEREQGAQRGGYQ
jgi:hypothetical protein